MEIKPSTPHAHWPVHYAKERFPAAGEELAGSVIYVYITEPYTTASASYTKPEMVQEDTR